MNKTRSPTACGHGLDEGIPGMVTTDARPSCLARVPLCATRDVGSIKRARYFSEDTGNIESDDVPRPVWLQMGKVRALDAIPKYVCTNGTYLMNS